jgi:hypothetical protein
VLFAHDGEIFIATLRTGDQVSDMDRAAIASVLSSFGFDDQPSPSAATVAVPDVIGMRLPDAEAALHEVGLEPRAETRTVDDVAEGLIASQDPAASSQVEPGSIVDLVVSGGPTVIGSGGSSHQIVSVGPLPQTGIVVSTPDGSTLLDTDGNVLATLPRFHLAGNPGAPGVWFESGLQYYALDPAAGRLDEVSRSTARSHMYDEGSEPDLAPPRGTTVGHWRYQLFPSVGTASLAQWSGECETPTAYWIDADGSEHIVTGERDLSAAPESVAIGWTPDGQALVFLPHGACGGSASQPGVYRYPAPGVGELVYPTGNDADAEMWDTP